MNTATDMPMPTASIRATFDRVRALAPPLVDTTADQRIAKIQRLMKTLMKYRQQIYETGKLERGLSPPDMDGELVMLKFEAEFIAKNLHDWMTPKPAEPSLMTLGKECYTHYEAKGMVLVLPSWNAPYVIGLLPTLGAIAAGNAVILKPSELSPHSSKLVARIVRPLAGAPRIGDSVAPHQRHAAAGQREHHLGLPGVDLGQVAGVRHDLGHGAVMRRLAGLALGEIVVVRREHDLVAEQ